MLVGNKCDLTAKKVVDYTTAKVGVLYTAIWPFLFLHFGREYSFANLAKFLWVVATCFMMLNKTVLAASRCLLIHFGYCESYRA